MITMNKLLLFIGALLIFSALAASNAEASYWNTWGMGPSMMSYGYNYPSYRYNSYPYYGSYGYGNGYGYMMANNYFDNNRMYNFAENTLDETYDFIGDNSNYNKYDFSSNSYDYDLPEQYDFYQYGSNQNNYAWNY